MGIYSDRKKAKPTPVVQEKSLGSSTDSTAPAKAAAQALLHIPAAEPVGAVQQKQKRNDTGLPDTLKAGIEHLSGYSLDDVRVHYNSDKPAGLQAHAYAQGTDIHVAPGQEQYLPHEAWHVVQQKQGRVQPTMQLKGGVDINNDKDLETEADSVGEMAMQIKPEEKRLNSLKKSGDYSMLAYNKDIMGLQESANLIKGAGKSRTVTQPVFKQTDGFEILAMLKTSDAPRVFLQLIGMLESDKKQFVVDLNAGHGQMSFNYETKVISLNAKSIMDAMAMKSKNEGNWKTLLDFVYASITHELRHAVDSISGMPMLSGVLSEVDDIWGLYKTELNAWQSEARAYLERGNTDAEMVKGFLSFDFDKEDKENEVWRRIIGYTDGPFKKNFPRSWQNDTWEGKMRKYFIANKNMRDHIDNLKKKFIERYNEQADKKAQHNQ